jgi:hypothetical protein
VTQKYQWKWKSYWRRNQTYIDRFGRVMNHQIMIEWAYS